jgi:DNA-binding NtrC family response regulator
VKNLYNPLIFIIDHSTAYRKILKNCLEALDYKNIHLYSNSEEMQSSKLSPDIIILDQELGDDHMKGLDFLKKYKTTYCNTHFIFLSSNTNIQIAVDSIKYGAFDYIIKSRIGLERLILKINKLVNNQIKLNTRKKIYNTAVVSLGMVSLILVVAVILYNHQLI